MRKIRSILELDSLYQILKRKLESKTPFIIKKGAGICGQQVYMTDCNLENNSFHIKFEANELKNIGPNSEILIFVGVSGMAESINTKAKTSTVSFKPKGVTGTVIL